jgi:hypothetical protein
MDDFWTMHYGTFLTDRFSALNHLSAEARDRLVGGDSSSSVEDLETQVEEMEHYLTQIRETLDAVN